MIAAIKMNGAGRISNAAIVYREGQIAPKKIHNKVVVKPTSDNNRIQIGFVKLKNIF